ncbi:MAG: hypothetical protein ACTSVV_14445 [Promethearchaeota archaeon]
MKKAKILKFKCPHCDSLLMMEKDGDDITVSVYETSDKPRKKEKGILDWFFGDTDDDKNDKE